MSAAFLAAHRARRRFSTEDLRALMAERITQSEAARRLGVTQAAVAFRLRSEGLVWPVLRREVDAETFARLWSCHTISRAEIGRWLGISGSAVGQRAQAMGLPSRGKARRRKVRADQLRELWLAGVASADIAALFGLASSASVRQAVKNAGLPRRIRGKGGRTHGGWLGTISLREYREAQLAEKMARAARGEAA